MNTNNGNEELRRALLMMNYNPSKTLTENVDEMTSLLNEDVKEKAGLLTEKGGGLKPKVNVKSSTHLKGTNAVTALKSERKALENTLDADIALANSKGKKLPAASVTKHKTDMVTKDVEIFANTPNSAGKYPSKDEIKAFTIQRSQKVGIDIDAKLGKPTTTTGSKTTTTGGKTTTTKGSKTTTTKGSKTTTPGKKAKSEDFVKGKETNWTKFKTAIKDMSRTKTFRYLAVLGGAYLAWKWYTSEDATPLPECITRSSSPEDFEKMNTQGLDYAIVTETGNSTVDSNGGGIFYDNKDFKTGNGRYSGTWSEEGGKIVMTIGSNQYPMDCAGTENPEPEKVKDQNSGVRYRDCTGGLYTQGCKTDPAGAIGQVQQCLDLVVDGKFWVKTQAALVAKGFDKGFKDSDIDTICGGSQQSLETDKKPLDGEQSLEAEDGGVASLTSEEPPAES